MRKNAGLYRAAWCGAMKCNGHCTHVRVSETVKLWRAVRDFLTPEERAWLLAGAALAAFLLVVGIVR